MAMAHPVDHPSHSPQAGHALTFTPDHLVGAGQSPYLSTMASANRESTAEAPTLPTCRKEVSTSKGRWYKGSSHLSYLSYLQIQTTEEISIS